MTQSCFCCSGLAFSDCCEPLLLGYKLPKSPEALMRSRFSAYSTKNYKYVLETYANNFRRDLSITTLKDSDADALWLKLDIVQSSQDTNTGLVEFKAYFSYNRQFYLLHELSEFILEDNRWLYTKGELIADATPYIPSRNDKCLCGSNKKYKKCCALI